MGVANQFFGFGVVFGTHGIGAVFIDGLRHESQMSHYRNASTYDASHRVYDFFTTFELQSVSVAFFHDTDGRSKSFHLVALIGSERHINHYHRTFHAAYHGFGMIDHLVECDRKCCHITCHYIGSGVAYQDYVHSRTVYNLCHCVIISSQHRYFFTSLFHFNQAMSSHLS